MTWFGWGKRRREWGSGEAREGGASEVQLGSGASGVQRLSPVLGGPAEPWVSPGLLLTFIELLLCAGRGGAGLYPRSLGPHNPHCGRWRRCSHHSHMTDGKTGSEELSSFPKVPQLRVAAVLST